MITSCGCTAAQPDKQKYAPADTIRIDYTLNTRALSGVIRKPITVYYDCGGQHSEKFVIQADVIAELDVIPRYLQFMGIGARPDTVITQCFSLQNHSNGPIRILNIHITEDFIRVSPSTAVIQQEAETQFQVQCTPKSRVRKMVYLTVETDCESRPRLSVPVYIDIRE